MKSNYVVKSNAIRSFFGKIYDMVGAPICFWLKLTFSENHYFTDVLALRLVRKHTKLDWGVFMSFDLTFTDFEISSLNLSTLFDTMHQIQTGVITKGLQIHCTF